MLISYCVVIKLKLLCSEVEYSNLVVVVVVVVV